MAEKIWSARSEIPETDQGLTLYISYCENAIKDNLLHNRRLKKRMDWCTDRLNNIRGIKGENSHGRHGR